MFKVWIVARREFLALISTKSFWLGLLLPPVAGFFTVLLALNQPALSDQGPTRILLADHSGLVAATLNELATAKDLEVVTAPDIGGPSSRLAEWSEELRQGRWLAVVEVPESISETEPIHIYMENVASSLAHQLDGLVTRAIQIERLKKAGLEPSAIDRVLLPVAVRTQRPGIAESVAQEKRAISFLLPFVTMILIMMGVMSGAVPLLQAVVEEKQQRISEVLLGSVSPLQLMFGKLLGTTTVGTTVLVFNLSGALVFTLALGLGEHIPLLALALALVVSVLAMLMYGSLFLALGAASSEIKEAQGLLMPAMLLFLAPLVSLPILTETPNHPLATGLSLFPLTAPLAMPARLGVTETVPGWQIAFCLVSVLLATLLSLWVAGRVFRIGVLSQGKLPTLRELGRWVLHG